MAKYRKKPVVVEAVKWTTDNFVEVDEFIGEYPHSTFPAMGFVEIETLEGIMTANKGDYIIKGVQGEFYPCKPDIFEKTYEEVKNSEIDSPYREIRAADFTGND